MRWLCTLRGAATDGQCGQSSMGAFPWQPFPGARVSVVYCPHANDSFSGREAIAFELSEQTTGGRCLLQWQ